MHFYEVGSRVLARIHHTFGMAVAPIDVDGRGDHHLRPATRRRYTLHPERVSSVSNLAAAMISAPPTAAKEATIAIE